ncbi:ATP synthase F1 subcomplex delta subunit [Acinetobacter marinus]|uniref:ATP synthase subunit delta n=1 Tax=Acinetobacter marinus TaxID=281375 RepID=A0A1G6LKB4_9GAMM|nr:F0F1 ATP synthase subunit delta [Acinetobacter marinus]SDC43066.1 ATP synthase F1 subcomplex delta subunit [Acinetobacter marinus]
MAELLTLARPYAKAAFGFAIEKGTVPAWSSLLQKLSLMVQDDAFARHINQPDLSKSEKVDTFWKVIGEDHSQNVKNFLTVLAENDRLALLPEISAEYELLKAQGNNAVDVVIESAFPLSAVQEQLLTNRLEKRFNKSVNTTVEVNPSLIAGVVIRAGDQVIDDSALDKLEKMRTRLLA